MRSFEDLIEYTITLQNLIEERDDWYATLNLYGIKSRMIDNYLSDDSESAEASMDISEKTKKAEKLLEGTEAEIYEFTNRGSIEAARELLINLKTLVNSYSKSKSQSFIEEYDLDNKESVDLLKIGTNLLGGNV